MSSCYKKPKLGELLVANSECPLNLCKKLARQKVMVLIIISIQNVRIKICEGKMYFMASILVF